MNHLIKIAEESSKKDPNLFPYKPPKNWVHLDRNQQKLWIKSPDGTILSENYAVSGKPGFMDPKYETLQDVGPIPRGDYTFRPKQVIENKRGMLQAMKNYSLTNFLGVKYLKRGLAGGDIAWGPYHWDITPKKGTNTFGRKNFTIHGGWIPGSIGCIDLANPSIKPMSTKDGLMELLKSDYVSPEYRNPNFMKFLKFYKDLINNNEDKIYPNANQNLDSFKANVEKYLKDQDEVLLRVSKYLKNNPNGSKLDNTKLAAFSDTDLDILIKNKENLSKLKDPLIQWQNRLRSNTEAFTQASTRDWLKNLGFVGKLKLFLSKLLGFDSDEFNQFKTTQTKAINNYIKDNLNQFRSNYEKKYGVGAFKRGLLTGDPRFVEYTSQWNPKPIVNNDQSKSFSEWVGNKMYQYAKPEISREFNNNWESQSKLPVKYNKKYWSDKIQNIYAKPMGGLFKPIDFVRQKLVETKLKNIPDKTWEDLSKLERFSDMFDNTENIGA